MRVLPTVPAGWRPALLVAVLSSVAALRPAAALDIDGVQPAALDQPRVNVLVQRPPAAQTPAAAHATAATGQVLSTTIDGNRVANVEAFLDTGASSSILSFHTVNQLGVQAEKSANGNPTRFTDVGLGGTAAFAVSEPLLLSIAPSNSDVDGAALDPQSVAVNYPLTIGPLRTEIGPLTQSNDLLASLAVADLDVVGTPAIAGRVIVMDMSAVNRVSDKIRTTLVDTRDRKAGGGPAVQVPATRLHVKLSFASFTAFTKTTPAGAQGPAVAPNPFVGPTPILSAAGAGVERRSARCKRGRRRGAPAGGELRRQDGGGELAARYRRGELDDLTERSRRPGGSLLRRHAGFDHPRLDGVSGDRQFTMNVAGVGGAGRHAAGFYLDALTLRTAEGEPLHFLHAPVLVTDITLKDQTDGHLYTLDGVLGMNFLTASAKLDTSALLPDVTNLTAGAFRYVVVDERHGLLGVTPN